MRFGISIELNKQEIPKDYLRMFLSLIKFCLKKDSPDFYEKMYGTRACMRKNFTYSVYLGKCKFSWEIIELSQKQAYMTVSSFDYKIGIKIYNALISTKNIPYVYKENVLTIRDIRMRYEDPIIERTVIFKTISPIVVREHNRSTNKDWFYSLSEKRGKTVFIKNLRVQLCEIFDENINDIEDMEIKIIKNKEVKVKHYGIEVLSNICILEVKAQPYISNYLYKAGVGSMKSTGFGMLKLVGKEGGEDGNNI